MEAKTEIGAYEVKTHLAALLRKVKSGEAYRITQRGEPVADLIPIEQTNEQHATRAASQMRQFMTTHPPVKVDVKAFIDTGRD